MSDMQEVAMIQCCTSSSWKFCQEAKLLCTWLKEDGDRADFGCRLPGLSHYYCSTRLRFSTGIGLACWKLGIRSDTYFGM
jgi:hypothetical protein